MRRLLYAFLVYMIIGLVSGFYYRELTKAHDFTGDTQLALVHTHTLILGMFMFLLLLPLEKVFKLSSFYLFNWIQCWCHYYCGNDANKRHLPSHWKKFFTRSICWICRYRSYRNACWLIITFLFTKTSHFKRTERLK